MKIWELATLFNITPAVIQHSAVPKFHFKFKKRKWNTHKYSKHYFENKEFQEFNVLYLNPNRYYHEYEDLLMLKFEPTISRAMVSFPHSLLHLQRHLFLYTALWTISRLLLIFCFKGKRLTLTRFMNWTEQRPETYQNHTFQN